MFATVLSRLMAALPPALKYRLAALRPLYTGLLGLATPVVTVPMTPGPVRWPIDRLTSQRHILASYEPHMQRALREWVMPGAVVYDVGAHAGFHTLFAALLVRPSGRVVAFEPYPENHRSLRRRLELNPDLSITLLDLAASDREARLAMRMPGDSSQSAIAADGTVQVSARPIDALVREGAIPPPDLIKVDVEGHEAAVLAGARETIATARPVILCDYNDAATALVVARALDGLGYALNPGPPVIAVPKDEEIRD